MATKFVSQRNIRFLLYEVMQAQRLADWPRFSEYDQESFDMMLDTAHRLSSEVLFPALRELDLEPPRFEDGKVLVRPMVRQFLSQAGEGGWVGATFAYEQGGLQLPVMINTACNFMFCAANYSATAYLGLITGATRLILTFGSEELQETYVPAMLEGRWQGTMALTEPQAGSSLADVAVSAEPTDEGHYLISGQKIFISAGDHDGADNVVHLMLARIKGAPAGVKGISLFVVPKLRPEGGELVSNDLATAGLFHKMGYRGCPIVQLSMGENNDCRGWLVGEPHRGLACMFQMMNEARISVGKAACAVASTAYYASLQYSQERLQGRPLGAKDPAQPQVPLIRHADIKRMLLMQRAVVEGSLSLILQAAWYADLHSHGPEEGREEAFLLLDLLTPVVKSYPSEMGVIATSAAVQILGGYGYTDEFPVEQLYRDMRIHPIHEGTTGIQGMDLLGRKAKMHQGRALKLFVQEVGRDIAAAEGVEALAPQAQRLTVAMGLLRQATEAKMALAAEGELENFLSDATLYLELFGLVAIAWQWLKQGLAAASALEGEPSQAEQDFYNGKLATMRYFFAYELPKAHGLAQRLGEDDGLTVAVQAEHFAD
ncbi:MAG: acyl-CoA dehydrogenase [Desulfarculaceae bacterium]|nr:acyl-CoA dehydrogenase [Desulfarculaceae bacterium]MCF8071694.1 acyl-CoA dehydrogenase [Desulfarculaceae bacterium]MCF8102459.1 acyl-CoA dehydrogenase [Desulfarculaceae bacterium]MCF8116801.1 acyl-CoA dehydrogenase [Desulfarculaceae bacterium]